MTETWQTIRSALGIGIDPKALTAAQTALRALAIYLAGLLLVRIGHKRFLGKNSAFDVLLAFVLGSLFSRSINGSGALLSTLSAAAVLLGIHWLFSAAAFRFRCFEHLIKGRSVPLISDGKPDRAALRRTLITDEDLDEESRLHGHLESDRLVCACLERSGRISTCGEQPRILDVQVRDGVQTVRIALHE